MRRIQLPVIWQHQIELVERWRRANATTARLAIVRPSAAADIEVDLTSLAHFISNDRKVG